MSNVVKNYQSKNRNIIKDFFSNLGPIHIIIFGVIGIIIIKITSNPNVNPRYNYIIYAILILIIIVIASKSNKEKILLDKETATKIAIEEVTRMRDGGKEFSYNSKVYPSGRCNLLETDNLATGNKDYTSWDIGFIEQVNGTQYKKDYVIRVHPYKGIILGVMEMPLGYTGKEKRDKEIIPVGVIMGTQKTTDIVQGKNSN